MNEEEYFCCGGMCPMGPLKKPCPKIPCLCLESFCCVGCAIAGNRFLIQTRFEVRNSWVDDMIILCVCVVTWAICILNLIGCDVPDEIEMCVDCLVQAFYACMLTQQQCQIRHVKKQGEGGMSAPGQQQMGQAGWGNNNAPQQQRYGK